MVNTTEQDVAVERCIEGIDINNSCRQVYLRRMESIEECKRTTETIDTTKTVSTIDVALMKLRIEMVGLMDQDAGLMRQMLILNEKVEELKANNICQMSKESLDSQDSLYQEDGKTDEYLLDSKDSLYHSDESLFDSKESLCNIRKKTGELCRDSVDSLYQTDEFSSDEENIDICDIETYAGKTSELLLDTNTSISCSKTVVDNTVSYDCMFERLLDFDDKL